MYMYINKDGNPSTKNTRHVEVNVNTWKGNQDHQNNSNNNEGRCNAKRASYATS